MSRTHLPQATETNGQKERPNQATRLLELVAGFPLFHDQLKRTFIAIPHNDHIEHWRIDDEKFSEWLSYQFYTTCQSAASKTAINDAIATLNGRARYEGEYRETALRTAVLDGSYYLDLCDKHWRSVQISPEGWQLVAQSPVPFYRSEAPQPLPCPHPGGNLNQLWEIINVPDHDRILVITFLLDCLRPDTNYPVLVLEGEQGSAKSTTQRCLKELIDPSAMPLRVPPKKIQDVFIGAGNDHLLSFTNLSHLPSDLQDAICCLATGGTYATRALYTNNQEAVSNIQRPVMLNGIGGLITRQDLLERTIYLDLPRIREGQRKTERDLTKRFEEQRPYVLGALLDLMVKVVRILPNTPNNDLPRMADYAQLGRAVAIAQGHGPDHFDHAYARNQRMTLEKGLESCPIYPALVSLLDIQQLGFSGTYQTLLSRINQYRDHDIKGWPQSSKALATTLKRQAPALRKVGIDIHFEAQRRQEGYYLSIQRRES